jgi:hypothetical protein
MAVTRKHWTDEDVKAIVQAETDALRTDLARFMERLRALESSALQLKGESPWRRLARFLLGR